jgi:hypothetical protein
MTAIKMTKTTTPMIAEIISFEERILTYHSRGHEIDSSSEMPIAPLGDDGQAQPGPIILRCKEGLEDLIDVLFGNVSENDRTSLQALLLLCQL